MMKIRNLHAEIETDDGPKPILNGVNLDICPGKVHVIMGPNGCGKSTLSKIIAGHPAYEVTGGSITLGDTDILELEPHERSAMGVFLAFQHPLQISGLTTMTFLKDSINTIRKARGEEPLTTPQAIKLIKEKAEQFKITDEMLKRHLNVGFSGGEQKRLEMLQMALHEPHLVIADEIDTGLDADAVEIVGKAMDDMRIPERAFLIVTHDIRLLRRIRPDFVHVMRDGQVVKTATGPELAEQISKTGYDPVFAQIPTEPKAISIPAPEPAPAGA